MAPGALNTTPDVTRGTCACLWRKSHEKGHRTAVLRNCVADQAEMLNAQNRHNRPGMHRAIAPCTAEGKPHSSPLKWVIWERANYIMLFLRLTLLRVLGTQRSRLLKKALFTSSRDLNAIPATTSSEKSPALSREDGRSAGSAATPSGSPPAL